MRTAAEMATEPRRCVSKLPFRDRRSVREAHVALSLPAGSCHAGSVPHSAQAEDDAADAVTLTGDARHPASGRELDIGGVLSCSRPFSADRSPDISF